MSLYYSSFKIDIREFTQKIDPKYVFKFKIIFKLMEEGGSAFKILIATPTGERSLGRPRRRWEDNIRIDLRYRHEELG